MNRDDRLVYSTDQPFDKREASKPRQSQAKAGTLPDDGIIRIARERRKASVVTIVHGLQAAELDAVARELKKRCGGGGTTKNGALTLQGDHRDTVMAHFEALGRRCKKAGG